MLVSLSPEAPGLVSPLSPVPITLCALDTTAGGPSCLRQSSCHTNYLKKVTSIFCGSPAFFTVLRKINHCCVFFTCAVVCVVSMSVPQRYVLQKPDAGHPFHSLTADVDHSDVSTQ